MLVFQPAADGRGAIAGRRVAITGIGVVAGCGIGAEAFWDGLLAPPPNGPRRAEALDASDLFGPKEIRRVDRFTQLSAVAAAEAIDDAGGFDAWQTEPARIGVWVGSGIGGLETLQEQVKVLVDRGARRVSPFMVPMMMANRAAADISMRYGFRGPCETTVTACAAGTHSVANAARLVASGRVDVAVGGSADAVVVDIALAGFTNMTALSPSGESRPFDVKRDGFVIGEGAGMLILEELEAAQARGAHIYGEILGSASTADAYHITQPSPDGGGAVSCMELALLDAQLQPGDITHINAHGTATPLNDLAEAEAVNKVFGTPGPLVTSIKGVTGHPLGAAGAIEAVALAQSIDKALLPPTAGLTELDPDIHLDVVTGEPRPWTPGPSLSNSFGFGGHNGTLVIAPVIE